MVTHDVGLKAFSNRVVRMADGKINKIQETPIEERNEIIRNLNNRVDAIHRGETENGLIVSEASGIGSTHDKTR